MQDNHTTIIEKDLLLVEIHAFYAKKKGIGRLIVQSLKVKLTLVVLEGKDKDNSHKIEFKDQENILNPPHHNKRKKSQNPNKKKDKEAILNLLHQALIVQTINQILLLHLSKRELENKVRAKSIKNQNHTKNKSLIKILKRKINIIKSIPAVKNIVRPSLQNNLIDLNRNKKDQVVQLLVIKKNTTKKLIIIKDQRISFQSMDSKRK